MEREPTEQSADVITFLNDILDSRHSLDRQLDSAQKTEIHATYSNYAISDFVPTPELDGLLPFANSTTSAELACSFVRADGEVRIEKITLTEEDSMPLEITPYDEFCEVGDGAAIREPSLDHAVLLTMIPEKFRGLHPDKQQLLDLLASNAPSTDAQKVFEHKTDESISYIVTTEHETVDDSIYSLEIIHLRQHPSDYLVGTRLQLTESLKKAARGQTDQKITVDVIRNGLTNQPKEFQSIDEIYRSDVVSKDVARITPTHMADVLEALEYLRQDAENH